MTILAFLVLAFLEARHPRQMATGVAARWATSFALYALALAAAFLAAPERIVLFLLAGWDKGPLIWIARTGGDGAVLATGLLLLDILAYALHRMQHLAPFWRFHAVHHADREMDASTALRHHPGEFLVNAAIGAVALAALGLPPWVVPVYVLLATLSDLWQHANVALPPWLDRRLALIVTTPGIHRIHHSVEPRHYDTNFGAVLTVWDRLCGTWHPAAAETLRFGVAGEAQQGPLRALLAPFRLSRRAM